MSQRIAIDCDVHGQRDEQADGVQYDVGLRGPGGQFQWLTVDLCDVCAKPLEDVIAELIEVGRPFDGKTPKPVGQRRGRPPIEESEENRTCPECGFVSTSRKAMTTHLRQTHNKSTGGKFKCEHCGEGFKAPQGLAAHTRLTHPDEFAAAKARAGD